MGHPGYNTLASCECTKITGLWHYQFVFLRVFWPMMIGIMLHCFLSYIQTIWALEQIVIYNLGAKWFLESNKSHQIVAKCFDDSSTYVTVTASKLL
ncbi:unnamed protein product [Rhizophagus irregularis]|nr:unnamed protein product [Rhizophagus irregularis]